MIKIVFGKLFYPADLVGMTDLVLLLIGSLVLVNYTLSVKLTYDNRIKSRLLLDILLIARVQY